MVIRILDHVEHASTYDDGEVIFNLLAPSIQRGEDITISFEGVSAVPSAFINASLVRLAEVVSVQEVRKHLRIVQSTRQINELVRSRFDFLAGPTSKIS